MFIDSKTQRRLNIFAPFESEDGTRYGNLTDPAVRAAVGVVEIPDPVAPDDYSDATYYRTEQDDAPYVVYTRKSDDQIAQARAAAILSKIAALEAQTLLPRVTREFMLIQFSAVASSQGVDPMTNVAYKKVKELDDQIAALRSQL